MEVSLRAQLNPAMENLISKTEEIYLNLANRFPELFKELELGFNESEQLISYFVNDMDENKGRENYGMVANIIQETESVINDASVYFLDMKERDEGLFESINRSIERLSTLEKTIENIREDSIEMELISLNAMTAALKAGKAGRAFSYITEELKKLSTHTIGYTTDLNSRGEEVLEILFKFRETVEKIQNFQQKFFGDFKKKLNESFETYNLGVKKLAEILVEVIDEAKSVKTPLFKIMEEVQLQDIIKQSVEHVIISVREINTDVKDESSESSLHEVSLDEIYLMEKIPQLCINLLDDVKEKINNSLSIFRRNFIELRQILKRVEEEEVAFLDYFTNDSSQESNRGALNQMFAESVGVLEELLTGIDNSMEEKKKINLEGQLILDGLILLKESFKNFFEIVDRFYSIEVASRIEVAKQEALKDREGTVTEMTNLTMRIETDVKGALQTIKDSLSRTGSSIRKYGEEIGSELAAGKKMSNDINESYERLKFSKTTLADTLKSFSVYTDRFYELIEMSEKDMTRLDELVQVINRVERELEAIRDKARIKKEQIMEATGINEWQIKSTKMKDMIERFTIFTHKKTAGDLVGFEVEQGSKPGDLTLF